MFKAMKIAVRRKIYGIVVSGLCAGLLAGCMTGSDETVPVSGVGNNDRGLAERIVSGGAGPIEVNPDAFAVDVYCPTMSAQNDTYVITRYVRGKENDPQGLLYHASLEEWARECHREGVGQTRIKVGLSGRVTPGPAWKGGDVVLPVNVKILPVGESSRPILSDRQSVRVNLGAGAPAAIWTIIEDKYVVARDQEMIVTFGFEGGRARKRR